MTESNFTRQSQHTSLGCRMYFGAAHKQTRVLTRRSGDVTLTGWWRQICILTMVLKACCSCCCCRRSRPQATHSPWQSQCPGVKRHASRTARHNRGIFIAQHTRQTGTNRSPAGGQSPGRESTAGRNWEVMPVGRGSNLQGESRQRDHETASIPICADNYLDLCGRLNRWWLKSFQPTPGDGQCRWDGKRAQPEAIN